MSIVLLKTWATILCVLPALSACTGQATSLASIEPPEGAKDSVESKSPDNAIKELSFSIAAERDSYSIVQQMENQLRALKYERCDKGSGRWERIEKHNSGRVVAESRVLRFYTTDKRGQLAAIIAYQRCGDHKETQCTQKITVRRQIAPPSLPNLDEYMQQVCQ